MIECCGEWENVGIMDSWNRYQCNGCKRWISYPVNQAKRESEANPQEFWTDDKVCAWCFPGSPGNSIGSHSICPWHHDKLLAEVRAMRNR